MNYYWKTKKNKIILLTTLWVELNHFHFMLRLTGDSGVLTCFYLYYLTTFKYIHRETIYNLIK